MVVVESWLRRNKVYVIGYVFWAKFILVEVIPYFTIVILNSAIVRKIWKSNQFRRRFVVNSNKYFFKSMQVYINNFQTIFQKTVSQNLKNTRIPIATTIEIQHGYNTDTNTTTKEQTAVSDVEIISSLNRIDVVESAPEPISVTNGNDTTSVKSFQFCLIITI